MNVNSADSSLTSRLAELAAQQRAGETRFSRTAEKQDANQSAGDFVKLSSDYRNYLQKIEQFSEASNFTIGNGWDWAGESTGGKFAGASVGFLAKYMDIGGGNGKVDLTSVNASREQLGRRINSVLANNGIKLDKNEKITVSIGSDNKIKVGGLKDKNKAKEIEKALNDDKTLSQDIRRHYANGKMYNHSKTLGKAIENGEVSLDEGGDIYTNRGMRAFVIDDYLQRNAGVSLSDLAVENVDGRVSILGMNDELAALISNDDMLGATIANILENGEQSLDFTVSFEFANGAIADGATEEMAKDRIKGLQEAVLALIDEYNKTLIPENGEMDEELEDMAIKGFGIIVKKDGTFEIANADKLDDKLVGIMTGMVNQVINNDLQFLSDISTTFLESHRFEHGDVDEFPHETQIDFQAADGRAKVVSEEADKEREQMMQQTSDELGKELRGLLEEKGVDVGEGIQVEIDETGKLKVVGDLSDPNLKMAQEVLDQFAQEAKTGALEEAYGDDDEYTRVLEERENLRHGEPKTAAGSAKAANKDTNPGGTFSPNVAKFDEKYWKTDDSGMTRSREELWHQALLDTYRDFQGTNWGGGVGRVSETRETQYAKKDAEGAGGVFGAQQFVSVWEEERWYGDDAKGKYQHILDSFNQFHDGKPGRKFTFTIA